MKSSHTEAELLSQLASSTDNVSTSASILDVRVEATCDERVREQ
jgi:hypothetical protein